MSSIEGSSGPAVDAAGMPVIDPTKNVLDLVEAANRRQDDLREQAARHRDQLDALRDQHAKEIREAEAARIDAIRAVDIGNVQRAAEVQATQALTLATQVTTSAETLRTQVQAAAIQSDAKLSAALEPIQKDIADLRRVQYEGVGQKTQVVETQARTGGVGLWIGLALGVVGILNAVMIAAVGFYLGTR